MRALTLALALGAAALASPAAADVFVFRTHMSGLLEEPANASPGTGFAKVTFDDVAFTMEVDAAWQDLTSIVTAAHIHGPTAEPGEGVAGVMTPTPSFPGFPTGTSGSYNMIFDMNQASSYRPGFLTAHGDDPHAAGLVVLGALQDGRAYFNIHTQNFPGGEIRGFLAVPEPEAWALMILGFGAAGAALRRRRPAIA